MFSLPCPISKLCTFGQAVCPNLWYCSLGHDRWPNPRERLNVLGISGPADTRPHDARFSGFQSFAVLTHSRPSPAWLLFQIVYRAGVINQKTTPGGKQAQNGPFRISKWLRKIGTQRLTAQEQVGKPAAIQASEAVLSAWQERNALAKQASSRT